MLKIESYKDVQEELIEYDLYIPINIKFGNQSDINAPIFYWRTGDFQESLIEIGIGKEEKEIRTITLTICNNVYERERDDISFLRTVAGVPIVAIECLENNMCVDYEGILKFCYDEDGISILFSESKPVLCIKNKSVNFLVDIDNNWIGLRINDLSKKNKEILMKALK